MGIDTRRALLQARYILDLAKHFQSGQLSDERIATMDDDTLVEELTKVKGIGEFVPSRALLRLQCMLATQTRVVLAQMP